MAQEVEKTSDSSLIVRERISFFIEFQLKILFHGFSPSSSPTPSDVMMAVGVVGMAMVVVVVAGAAGQTTTAQYRHNTSTKAYTYSSCCIIVTVILLGGRVRRRCRIRRWRARHRVLPVLNSRLWGDSPVRRERGGTSCYMRH
eukprot:TRINITY_DN9357_c0_g1_i1.p1 TRINITY_DN9357_c0_g1~~TRINITY_DN9357_c0_g1_i1.p1  ORF type:complete len:143 (-),score=9.25 TRINITY_DN9357_c0_g1_i1:34-462(-)